MNLAKSVNIFFVSVSPPMKYRITISALLTSYRDCYVIKWDKICKGALKDITCPEMLVSSPPHLSSELGVVYLRFVPECSTDISNKSEMDLYKFLPTPTFPFLQMALPPNQMFKPETYKFPLIPPSPSLLLPICHHALVIQLLFSGIWALL